MSSAASHLGAALFLSVAWWVTAFALKEPYLPSPIDVFRALGAGLGDGLAVHVLVSLRRIAVAMALSIAVGVPVGLALGRNRILGSLGSPILHLIFPIPKVVLLPILIMAMGLGDAPKVALIALTLVFQIAIPVRDAAAGLPDGYLLAMRSLGATGLQSLIHMVVPYCLPAIITGVRIGIGTSVAVLFLAETFATSEGLGYLVMDSWGRADYPRMYAGMAVMSLLGLGLYAGTDLLERLLCPWRDKG